MKYGEFRKLMKSKSLGGAYLFTGDEGLVMERTIDYIVNSYVDETYRDFNYSVMTGEDFQLDNFYSAMATLPFMSSKRVIIINELQALISIGLSDVFFDTIRKAPEDLIAIFYDSEQNLKKFSKLYQFFKKENRLVEFDKLNNYEVIRFLKKEILKRNKSISDSDLSYFIMLTGYLNKKMDVNLYNVNSELEKLIAYSEEESIGRNHIDELIEKANDSDIFNLLDALSKKNSRVSLGYLYDLYDKNEPMESILYMIQRRYRHIYHYLSLYQAHKREDEIKEIVGIPSTFEFKIVSQASREHELFDIKKSLEYILKTDLKLKSTSHNKLLLMEFLIVNICK